MSVGSRVRVAAGTAVAEVIGSGVAAGADVGVATGEDSAADVAGEVGSGWAQANAVRNIKPSRPVVSPLIVFTSRSAKHGPRETQYVALDATPITSNWSKWVAHAWVDVSV